MGYCVVIPDVVSGEERGSHVLAVVKGSLQTFYPEARVKDSVVDLRLVLRWVGDNCERYGGDMRRIHLLGHGMSAHLAMLTLTQEAVVLSREGYLQRHGAQEWEREKMMRWDDSSAATEEETQPSNRDGSNKRAGNPPDAAYGEAPEDNAWVDEPNEDELPPGAIMAGSDDLPSSFVQSAGGESTSGSSTGRLAFPSLHPRQPDAALAKTDAQQPSTVTTAVISNGLRRVEIYEPEIEIPPIAGIILLAGVFDVIKCFRGESDRGVEHLSVLRRSCGPSHTSCLVSVPEAS